MDVLVGVRRLAVNAAAHRELSESGVYYDWIARRRPSTRALLGNAFRAPPLIIVGAILIFSLSAAAPLVRVIASITTVLVGAGMIVYFLAAIVVERSHRIEVEKLSGLHFDRTSGRPRDPTNAAHPVIVVLAVSSLVVLAYATLYHALSVSDAQSFSEAQSKTGFAGRLGPLDALYFSAVTMATVGYGDIGPLSDAARLAVVSQIGLGVTSLSLFVSSLLAR
jgi:hypothetical protein